MSQKKSFFERLAGSITTEEQEEEEEIEVQHNSKKFTEAEKVLTAKNVSHYSPSREYEEEDEVGELNVDVYQTTKEVIIEAMVAGVKPEDLHINITRDIVTIKGKREGNSQISEEDYFYREVYWGSFSRTISLPHEIETEGAEAVEKHGLLIIRLPKIDKEKNRKVNVKSI